MVCWLLFFSPYLLVQFCNLCLVGHEACFAAVGAALLHWHIAVLSLPQADIGVVGAFGGLRVWICRVFDEGATVGTHIAELAVLAHVDLVLADGPAVLEARLFDGLFQGGVADIAIGLLHRGAVPDVTVGIDADFSIEAGVVVLGLSE